MQRQRPLAKPELEMMNRSKSYGPSGNRRAPCRRRTRCAVRVASSPPRPSPLGRGGILRCFGAKSARFERSQRGDAEQRVGSSESVDNGSLYLEGERQGEGERGPTPR